MDALLQAGVGNSGYPPGWKNFENNPLLLRNLAKIFFSVETGLNSTIKAN